MACKQQRATTTKKSTHTVESVGKKREIERERDKRREKKELTQATSRPVVKRGKQTRGIIELCYTYMKICSQPNNAKTSAKPNHFFHIFFCYSYFYKCVRAIVDVERNFFALKRILFIVISS